MSNYALAFSLTLLAGLATGIGGLIGLYTKKDNFTFLSGSLGFSAGVMLYVSFIEIFPKAKTLLQQSYGASQGYLYATLAFFAGIAIIALIDFLIPEEENPHELQNITSVQSVTAERSLRKSAHDSSEKTVAQEPHKALMRMGLFTALAIGIHNFPEGLATFTAALSDPQLGISIAIAIAIHNIPEGIAVSVPIFFATGNKKRAFAYSLLSGLAEPIGAVVGYVVLMQFLPESAFGIVFALVAGIMVYISLDELLPAAEKYGKHHVAIIGVIAGMAVMALSLLLFSKP